MQEREFVLLPMCELNERAVHPVLHQTMADLMRRLRESQSGKGEAVRVLPLPRGRMLRFTDNTAIVMGILNVTPDSFSDGGQLQGSVEKATQEALQMVSDGAGIVDIGGESTRPGAKEVDVEQELERTIPVILSIRRVSDIPISIDTRHAEVARKAIEAGADMVNDVSGGTLDPDMLHTVAELQVPIVLMHSRGTPETMQTMTGYDDVVSSVATALEERSRAAQATGIPRWLQVVDPGIGFAKDLDGNLQLLKHACGKLRENGDTDSRLRRMPLLLGASRKGFIGKLTGETDPQQRDFGSAAACVVSLLMNDHHNKENDDGQTASRFQTDCCIVRVHNVKGIKQSLMIMEAIRDAN